jgi:hypothetical protein
VGWIREEYELAGVDFGSRGKRMDELIEVMRKLWSGREVSHHGRFFNFDHAIMCPAAAIACTDLVRRRQSRGTQASGDERRVAGPPDDARATAPGCGRSARDAPRSGPPGRGFTISFALAEPTTRKVMDELERLGVHDLMVIAPWIASPWDVERWVGEREDTRLLDVKKQALERYSSRVIGKQS